MAKHYRLLEEDSLWFPAERPNLAIFDFGLAWGAIWALAVFVFTAMKINAAENNQALNGFIGFLAAIYPGYSPPFDSIDLALGLVNGFLHGFLFGTLIAFLYNVWRGEQPFGVKLPRNFAGSPQPFVISAGQGELPYTVAIIANPVLESQVSGQLKRDPILDYPRLFQAKAATIIAGFATNPVVNDPDPEAEEKFLDRMRIVALFNPNLANRENAPGLHPTHHPPVEQPKEHALCRELDHDIIVEPIQRIIDNDSGAVREERLLEFIKKHLPEYYDQANGRCKIDVVYVVTASKTHTRSSSRYTFDDEKYPGRGFSLNFGAEQWELRHDPFAKIPGMVAYSAWDDRLKTPIHEFAHAMSSTTNGAILDEYYDELPDMLLNVHAINKHFWQTGPPFPEQYAEYALKDGESIKIRTDRSRHTPSDWKTCVPGRESLPIPCTMDFSGEQFDFDLLIKQYMRDRLKAKTRRVQKIQEDHGQGFIVVEREPSNEVSPETITAKIAH
jgi:hypothetical protein